jgi:hypothetical protein
MTYEVILAVVLGVILLFLLLAVCALNKRIDRLEELQISQYKYCFLSIQNLKDISENLIKTLRKLANLD